MTSFDDKEKGAENKYALDKEMEFKIHARAHKLLGLWVAQKMGMSGDKAEAYAQTLVTIDMVRANPQHFFEKIRSDLLAHDLHLSDHDIKMEMYRCEQAAREQLAKA